MFKFYLCLFGFWSFKIFLYQAFLGLNFVSSHNFYSELFLFSFYVINSLKDVNIYFNSL